MINLTVEGLFPVTDKVAVVDIDRLPGVSDKVPVVTHGYSGGLGSACIQDDDLSPNTTTHLASKGDRPFSKSSQWSPILWPIRVARPVKSHLHRMGRWSGRRGDAGPAKGVELTETVSSNKAPSDEPTKYFQVG